MLERWSDFFLMVGSSGAALIGLLFVVATLSAGRERSTAITGASLYLSPIVFHLAGVFLVSAAAMADAMPLAGFGWVVAGVALVGALVCARVLSGMRRAGDLVPHWTDPWFYGVVPLLLYAALGGAASAVLAGRPWGVGAVGLVAVALLLASIRNAWDLVTWLTPGPSPDDLATGETGTPRTAAAADSRPAP